MVKRVVIQGGGSAPIRVSAAGVSVDGAQFNDLIFDGNQPPLRLYATGYTLVPPIYRGANSVQTIQHVVDYAAPIPQVPDGTTPLFIVATRQRMSEGNTYGYLMTPTYRGGIDGAGGGGAISNVDGGGLRFVALSFTVVHDEWVPPQPDQPDNLVNYCIFRNAQ